MARALKTYLTSIGFFDLAVAAPSMKAALEAWGVQRNLFQQGVAWETDGGPSLGSMETPNRQLSCQRLPKLMQRK